MEDFPPEILHIIAFETGLSFPDTVRLLLSSKIFHVWGTRHRYMIFEPLENLVDDYEAFKWRAPHFADNPYRSIISAYGDKFRHDTIFSSKGSFRIHGANSFSMYEYGPYCKYARRVMKLGNDVSFFIEAIGITPSSEVFDIIEDFAIRKGMIKVALKALLKSKLPCSAKRFMERLFPHHISVNRYENSDTLIFTWLEAVEIKRPDWLKESWFIESFSKISVYPHVSKILCLKLAFIAAKQGLIDVSLNRQAWVQAYKLCELVGNTEVGASIAEKLDK